MLNFFTQSRTTCVAPLYKSTTSVQSYTTLVQKENLRSTFLQEYNIRTIIIQLLYKKKTTCVAPLYSRTTFVQSYNIHTGVV